jgi:hypothetical protein
MDITTYNNRQRRHVRPPGGMPRFYSNRLTEELTQVPLTKDDYLASRTIQRSISIRITAIVHQLLKTAEPLDDTEDTDIDCIIAEPLVSESLFDYLIDSDRLPDSEGNKRIVYELVANRLVVGIMPSACHDYTAASFTEDLLLWAASGGVRGSLEIGHGACTPLIYLSLSSLVFPWAVGSKKSPDNSFRPTHLQSPPGRHIGNSNVLYPNFTIEVAKSHESWDRLIADGISKHFSPMTGIVLWLGIKIYRSERMRVCLLERDMAQGFGALNPPLASTGFISTTEPCNASIVIPKRLLFHGVPTALIPPTLTPDYVLDLNILRVAIDKNFEA